MYLVAGHFTFKDEGLNRAKELMNEIVSIGRTEPGIQQYRFYPNPDGQNAYFLFEEWDSKELHDVHFNRDEMQAILPQFFELLAAAPDVSYFDASLESKL